MKTAVPCALAALSLLLSAGCARDRTAYPSLAPRAVEKLGFAEPEMPVEEARPDPALDARIVMMGRSLDALAKGFDTDAGKAEAAAARARGKAVGSDAWLDAQTALAALDDWRAQTSSLLTEIDRLAGERAATLAAAYPSLGTLRDRVATESDRQGATIDRLQSALPAA